MNRDLLPKTFEDYIDSAKRQAARRGLPGAMIFNEFFPPVHKLAANGIDTIIDEEATKRLYWGDEIKTPVEVEAMARVITFDEYSYGRFEIEDGMPSEHDLAHVEAKVESRWPERLERAESYISHLEKLGFKVVRIDA